MQLLEETILGKTEIQDSRTYVEKTKDYTLEVEVENCLISVQGYFLGENLDVRKVDNPQFWQKVIGHIEGLDRDIFEKVFCDDVRTGAITKRRYRMADGKEIEIQTNIHSPF